MQTVRDSAILLLLILAVLSIRFDGGVETAPIAGAGVLGAPEAATPAVATQAAPVELCEELREAC